MKKQTWLITGISSGFGLELTKQLLANGQTVIGTVRKDTTVQDLMAQYPETFDREFLDLTDATGIKKMLDKVYEKYGAIDVLVNNAGYGLFGAAEELTDQEAAKIIATNLTGSIQMIRAVTPFMREQQAGRIIQISSYGGQVAFAGNSMYHATKWGIEGFCESVAQELAPFNIGVTIVEPSDTRTEFHYVSAQVAELMPEYDNNPAHAFLTMLDPANGLAASDPERMATRIIESAAIEPALLRMVLGSQALDSTIQTLEKRVADFKKQTELAASTDF
ncbi:SDR family oxidoreductase [Enterococcus ureilyticus]|uniref:SDR family oxidoreductase n=1 Tax=Enterococcus ureilyticus TaxID=1131292 RepID=UPI001A9211F9|nr:SDR family oxidoreductase [Enterococcus ureilyticus]MBO0446953.1 SDR family oxidoreductase [Enterococcus ureilyticus]